MTRQLSTLLDANTPIVDALEITAKQLKNKDLIYVLFSLKEDIVQGKRLGNSMKKFPVYFQILIYQWSQLEIRQEI
jgi:type II secretory pathway component PulF